MHNYGNKDKISLHLFHIDVKVYGSRVGQLTVKYNMLCEMENQVDGE